MAAAIFEPKTDSFGQLVIHSRPRMQPMAQWAHWPTRAEDEDSRRSRNHLFIAIGFVTAFVTLLSGLYVIDSSIYPQSYAHPLAAASANVDYD
ncbi:MAG: hypothetical protein ACXU8O_08120 [Asticcacaulis sp.]